MKKFKALTRWVIINVIFLILAYYAAVKGYEPAEHIVTFACWFFAIISLALFSDKAVKDIYSKESATFTYLRRWVDITYDIAVIGLLLYPGWYATTAAYVFFVVMQQTGYDRYNEMIKKEKENEEASGSGGSSRSVRAGGETPQQD